MNKRLKDYIKQKQSECQHEWIPVYPEIRITEVFEGTVTSNKPSVTKICKHCKLKD